MFTSEYVRCAFQEFIIMGKKGFKIEKYVSYNEKTRKSTCLMENCRKEMCGKFASNIKRHYKLVHKLDITGGENENNESGVSKKSKTVTELNITLSKHDFIKCCVGLVTKKNMPFQILDDEKCFKRLMRPYEEKFNVNLNSKNIRKVLEKANYQIQSEIAALVKNKMICLKIDIASRMEIIVVGINIQYIKDYKVCNNTIGIIQPTKRHTAANLKEDIIKCLSKYDININQIYSNTTDNGANALNVSMLLKEMQEEILTSEETDVDITDSNRIESELSAVFSAVRCVAHTVQLAASEVIKAMETDIDECRKITQELRTSVKFRKSGINLPCLDVITRWNSTNNMINTILSLKDIIENLNSTNHIDVNWIFVKNFVRAFKPLANCTSKLQQEQYLFGDFFRDWLACELELEELVPLNPYAESLLNAMRKRKDVLLSHDTFAAALYLDPRFNFRGTPFLNDDLKEATLDYLIKVNEMIHKLKRSSNNHEYSLLGYTLSTLAAEDSLPSTSATPYEKLTLHVRSLRNAQISSQNVGVNLKRKLMQLCEGEMVPFDTNVLEHWRKLYSRDAEMTQLAEVVLAVPATQSSMEHTFSALATILTKIHSKLSNSSLSNVLLTKLNFELLDIAKFDLEDTEIKDND